MKGATLELAQRFLEVSTCQVSDALARVGLDPLGLVGIRALEPARKFAGPAFTVRCVSTDLGADPIEYLGLVEPGDAIVISNEGKLHCSVWGGQRSLGALQAGAVGSVIDGAYRDVEEHRALGYPVFGRASAVAGSRAGGAVPAEANVPLRIGDTPVTPGDWVIGDASGVVVVPRESAEEVLATAHILAAQEARVTAAVQSGQDFLTNRARERGGAR